MATTVRDNPDESRYEILVDGRLAGIEDYTLAPGVISFDHTEVFPEFTGAGVAAQLVTEALDDVRARGLSVLPDCPYVARFIARAPERYLDLVPAERRAEFGLPGAG